MSTQSQHVSAADRGRLLAWNATARPYPRDATVHELFRRQARAEPARRALAWRGTAITYGELDAATDALAMRCIEAGVRPGDRVGLLSAGGAEAIASMLAIMKAGAAYVPLSPTVYTPELLSSLVGDAGVRLVLTPAASPHAWPAGLSTLGVEIEAALPPPGARAAADAAAPLARVPRQAGDEAYVMFTSGSTGTPKGVVVTHRAIVNLAWNAVYAPQERDAVLLQLAPLSFDASTFEIWSALLLGRTLVLYPDEEMSFVGLARTIADERVSTLWLTAGVFAQIARFQPEILRPLRCLLTGGDIVPAGAASAFLQANPSSRLVNGYGPTECTTFTCCHVIEPADLEGGAVPIGRPIPNVRVYILDDESSLAAIGESGELCVAGDGLAIGYLRSGEAAAQAFTTVDLGDGLIERLYRTGDLARYGADGAIAFVGRKDRQVKLRGFRVAPEAVEAAMRACPGVREACAIIDGESADTRQLVAYYAPGPPDGPSPSRVRESLRERLPSYAMPATLTPLPSLPLTPSGKYDRARLRAESP